MTRADYPFDTLEGVMTLTIFPMPERRLLEPTSFLRAGGNTLILNNGAYYSDLIGARRRRGREGGRRRINEMSFWTQRSMLDLLVRMGVCPKSVLDEHQNAHDAIKKRENNRYSVKNVHEEFKKLGLKLTAKQKAAMKKTYHPLQLNDE